MYNVTQLKRRGGHYYIFFCVTVTVSPALQYNFDALLFIKDWDKKTISSLFQF